MKTHCFVIIKCIIVLRKQNRNYQCSANCTFNKDNAFFEFLKATQKNLFFKLSKFSKFRMFEKIKLVHYSHINYCRVTIDAMIITTQI